MSNYYKYLPLPSKDKDWGLQVLHAGCYKYHPGKPYPDTEHPSHHNFSWENGRTLQEYSLVYITGGEGIYNSSKTGDIEISGGSVIILFPNEKHRYRPNPDTGWTEYWIGFDGPIMDNLVEKNFFNPRQPVVDIGYNETIINLYIQILTFIKKEHSDFQPLVCGAANYILGQLYSSAKHRLSAVGEEEKIIAHARLFIRSNLTANICPKHIASELKISYSRFRKLFKLYTGIAPVQYHIQLKVEKAKEELVNTQKSIKEIAYELNFESSRYFSSQFKDKTKLTPIEFRKSFRKGA